MFKKILVAYEGSQNARRALDAAAELSKKLEADLIVVHVLMHGRPSSELVRMAEVEHLVERAQKTALPDVAYATGQLHNFLGGSGATDQTARVITVLGDQLFPTLKAEAKIWVPTTSRQLCAAATMLMKSSKLHRTRRPI